MDFYTKVLRWLMPDGTRRGEFRKIVVASLRIARRQRIRSLLRQAWEKVGRREFRILEPRAESIETPAPILKDHLSFLLRGERDQTFVTVPPIAIIIPVYNAPDYLKKCLSSVIRNTPPEHEIIVIDDCNTDTEVLETLRSLPEERFTILRNDRNLGFVMSVNRGITYARDRHVVILNQDTEVPPKWIERLILPIERDPRIASVTPFSNGSTTTSFPEPFKDNEPYLGMRTEDIDIYFQKFGGEPVDIPSAIGFCMALNRRVLDEIGLFDYVTFGRGYAEENDWSMRAWKRGYRNVAVTNLFVYHKHGASFGDDKTKILSQNLMKLGARHPEYFPWVDRFIKDDPFSPLRNTVKAIIDVNVSRRTRILCLTHNFGGGSETFLDMLRNIDEVDLLVARWDCGEKVWIFSSGDLESYISDEVFNRGLTELCTIFSIEKILVNQVVSHPHPTTLLNSIERCGKPYIFAIHDYFCYCPNWNLIGPSGFYCGLPDLDSCLLCLKTNTIADYARFEGYGAIDPSAWRIRWTDFLKKAYSVVCFSKSSAELIGEVYPQVVTRIVEHSVPIEAKERETKDEKKILTVGLIGGIGVHKGSEVLKELFGLTRDDPIRYIIVGTTNWIRGPYTSPDNRVEVTGRYDDRESLGKILSSKEVDLILFSSVWPETYAFTVSEAMLLGYPVISFDLGAPSERIKKTGAGTTLKELSSKALRDLLIRIAEDRSLLELWSRNTKRFHNPDREFRDNWREILTKNSMPSSLQSR